MVIPANKAAGILQALQAGLNQMAERAASKRDEQMAEDALNNLSH